MRSIYAQDGLPLPNIADTGFRTIVEYVPTFYYVRVWILIIPSLSGFTTLAIAVDIGPVTTETDPIVYAVGLVRDPVIQYVDPEGQVQELSPLYRTSYNDTSDLVGSSRQDRLGLAYNIWFKLQAVFDNFTSSVAAAQEFDAKIASDGGQISSDYADLLAISTRQAFSGADLTAGSDELPGVRAFAWDIGALGSGGYDVSRATSVIY